MKNIKKNLYVKRMIKRRPELDYDEVTRAYDCLSCGEGFYWNVEQYDRYVVNKERRETDCYLTQNCKYGRILNGYNLLEFAQSMHGRIEKHCETGNIENSIRRPAEFVADKISNLVLFKSDFESNFGAFSNEKYVENHVFEPYDGIVLSYFYAAVHKAEFKTVMNIFCVNELLNIALETNKKFPFRRCGYNANDLFAISAELCDISRDIYAAKRSFAKTLKILNNKDDELCEDPYQHFENLNSAIVKFVDTEKLILRSNSSCGICNYEDFYKTDTFKHISEYIIERNDNIDN